MNARAEIDRVKAQRDYEQLVERDAAVQVRQSDRALLEADVERWLRTLVNIKGELEGEIVTSNGTPTPSAR